MRYSTLVSEKLDENLETLKHIFHAEKNSDIVFRPFKTGGGENCFLSFIDGMADSHTINEFILRPMLTGEMKGAQLKDALQVSSLDESGKMGDAVKGVLNGDTVVFAEGQTTCYICETKGFEKRGIGNPTTENTIKGSQEAFSESLRSNTTLLHRIMKTTELCTEFVTIGKINQNLCAIMYLDDIANKKVIEELRKRLASIEDDFVMGSGMVEQLVEDNPLSLFPSILSTERPDRASHYLNSGRVLLVVDGTPFAIVLPVTLPLLLDSPEGSSQRWQNGTFSRLLRILAFLCSTTLSGAYLALILFHRELIPTTLLGAIVSARSNIPFPSVLEVLAMELCFELVREAGLRIPHMLGNAIGIVGALILGQSAVEANLVSPVTLIVVALSGLGNSALPDYDLAYGLRTIKIFIILMSSGFGFLGLAIALALVVTVLANQNSFGVPMLSMQALKWSAGTPLPFQLPLWRQETRPRENHPQKDRQKPETSRKWLWNQGEED